MFGNNDSKSSSSLEIPSCVGNNSNNSTTSEHVLSAANNHETFLKLDIESLLTDLHQQTHHQKTHQNTSPTKPQENLLLPTSHNSINGIFTQQQQNFPSSSSSCSSLHANGSRRNNDEPFEYAKDKISDDSDKLEESNKKKESGNNLLPLLIVSNSLSSATVQQQQQNMRNLSNNSQQQQQKLFTIVQYDPQQQANNSNSSPLTYHHISPSNHFPILSNIVSDKKSKKSKASSSTSIDNYGKSKRERTTQQSPSLESQFFPTNSSTSTFQWSENEFQEFTSGQHETQKRQRKERVYKFYESGPMKFSEDPQSATSLVSNYSIFDSNSPNSPPVKKTKRKKKDTSSNGTSQ